MAVDDHIPNRDGRSGYTERDEWRGVSMAGIRCGVDNSSNEMATPSTYM